MRNIIIVVGETAIGAVQSIDVTESKDKDGYTVNVAIDAKRIRFSKERIKEAFEKGFVNVANQIYPFDIVVMDNHLESCRIRNTWLFSTDFMYDASEWIILNQALMQAEKIIGTLNKSDEPLNDVDS